MPDEPIKFRCYRCGKLLGASARRVGAVVPCPQCRAEIQVPAPEAGETGSQDVEAEEVSLEPDFTAIVAATTNESAVPAIHIDPIRPGTPVASTPRAPDVVLPPGVVMAWSLLVLLAVPLAFAAGLLLGHFVWK